MWWFKRQSFLIDAPAVQTGINRISFSLPEVCKLWCSHEVSTMKPQSPWPTTGDIDYCSYLELPSASSSWPPHCLHLPSGTREEQRVWSPTGLMVCAELLLTEINWSCAHSKQSPRFRCWEVEIQKKWKIPLTNWIESKRKGKPTLVQRVALGSERPGFRAQLYCFLTLSPMASHLTSPNPSFLIWKIVRVITASISEGSREISMR